MSRHSMLIVIVAVLPALGCDTTSDFQPTQPGLPAAIRTVTGTVWIHTASGIEPGRNRSIVATFWRTPSRTVMVTTDGEGRYQVTVTQPEQLFLRAVGGHQPCVAFFQFGMPTTLDVHVIDDVAQLGANIPSALRTRGQTLSGRVFERIADAQVPVAGAEVELGPSGPFSNLASTLTDADGRYVFCDAVPAGLRASKTSYDPVSRFDHFDPFDQIFLATTVDIELGRSLW